MTASGAAGENVRRPGRRYIAGDGLARMMPEYPFARAGIEVRLLVQNGVTIDLDACFSSSRHKPRQMSARQFDGWFHLAVSHPNRLSTATRSAFADIRSGHRCYHTWRESWQHTVERWSGLCRAPVSPALLYPFSRQCQYLLQSAFG